MRTESLTPLGSIVMLGIVMVGAISLAAGPLQRPVVLVDSLRAALVVTATGIAFVLSDPLEDLVETLPTPLWHLQAVRVALGLPVLALGAAVELLVATHAFVTDEGLQGLGHRSLAWPGLVVEFAGFCALALLVTSVIDRGRWRDLGGVLAAPIALGLVAALALTPLDLFPTAYLLGPTRADSSAWVNAELWWALVTVSSVLVTAWASRDRWKRMRRRVPAIPLGDRHQRTASRS